MNNEIASIAKVLPIIALIFIIQILTPKMNMKKIYFGIRIPEKQLENEELKKIYKQYVVNNIIVSVPYVIIASTLLYYFSSSFEKLSIVVVIIYFIITFIVYSIANKKVKELNYSFEVSKGKKSSKLASTKFTEEKDKNILASPLWFLIPIIIIVINIIIGFYVYNKLPDTIPSHLNAAGEVDQWGKKSYKLIFQMPTVQILMTAIIFFLYKVTGRSREEGKGSSNKQFKERNIVFKYRWSVYMVIMSIAINIFFTFGNLSVLNVINMSSRGSMIFIFTTVILMIATSIVMSIKMGRGGSKINIENKCDKK